MDIQETLAYIHGCYQFGSKLGLDNIRELLRRLDNPQDSLKFVHVAGTNGKGSTCSFISSVLTKSGLKTGLYTSPYIEIFNERMQIDHKNISDEALCKYTQRVKEKVTLMVEEGFNHPTEFEIVTAIAMLFFKEEACEVVILEVGLGGRLDATNVIECPIVSVITPLGLDHVEYLGHTIDKIAFEKAGIIKTGGVTICHPQEAEAMAVIERIAAERNNLLRVPDVYKVSQQTHHQDYQSFVYCGFEFKLKMLAPYQVQNAVMAIEVLKYLHYVGVAHLSLELIQKGLEETIWAARLETVSLEPRVVIDGAHNAHGLIGLKEAIEHLYQGQKITALIGVLGDKAIEEELKAILPFFEKVITTVPNSPRAMSARDLQKKIKALGYDKEIEAYETIQSALKAISQKQWQEDEMLLSFGSLYMIGEVRQYFRSRS